MSTFVKTADGFKVTTPEGYVVADSTQKAVKLVDRLEFSFNNFTAQKNWDNRSQNDKIQKSWTQALQKY